MTNYRNAKYIDTTRIDCEIEHEIHGWIPYTIDPADTDMTINNDDLLAAMGAAGDVAAYVPPTQAELDAALSDQLREHRNSLLSVVDSIAGNALRWATLSSEQQDVWAVYRQALLDVPQQSGFPNDVTWPVSPS
jgi:serine protease inhibitor